MTGDNILMMPEPRPANECRVCGGLKSWEAADFCFDCSEHVRKLREAEEKVARMRSSRVAFFGRYKSMYIGG